MLGSIESVIIFLLLGLALIWFIIPLSLLIVTAADVLLMKLRILTLKSNADKFACDYTNETASMISFLYKLKRFYEENSLRRINAGARRRGIDRRIKNLSN
ncbi:MAG: hypothetical protein ACYDAO_04770 [Thermoplasmataceae archaeon]